MAQGRDDCWRDPREAAGLVRGPSRARAGDRVGDPIAHAEARRVRGRVGEVLDVEKPVFVPDGAGEPRRERAVDGEIEAVRIRIEEVPALEVLDDPERA